MPPFFFVFVLFRGRLRNEEREKLTNANRHVFLGILIFPILGKQGGQSGAF